MNAPMNMQENKSWSFHHLGVACRSIEKEASAWLDIGYRQEGEIFSDTTQGVRGMFLTGPGPRLELLEDLPDRTTVAPWLEKGCKFYHTAYDVSDLDAEVLRLEQLRARIVVKPVPAIAFGNRRVCFLLLKNFSLIELIESE